MPNEAPAAAGGATVASASAGVTRVDRAGAPLLPRSPTVRRAGHHAGGGPVTIATRGRGPRSSDRGCGRSRHAAPTTADDEVDERGRRRPRRRVRGVIAATGGHDAEQPDEDTPRAAARRACRSRRPRRSASSSTTSRTTIRNGLSPVPNAPMTADLRNPGVRSMTNEPTDRIGLAEALSRPRPAHRRRARAAAAATPAATGETLARSVGHAGS